MSNEPLHDEEARRQAQPPLNSVRRLALERLVDQIDPHGQPEEQYRRVARRLCGRWLLLRRVARGLSLAMVAERTGIGTMAIELLELGLLADPAIPEEAWLRLALVLEHQANDYKRVADALAVARGAAPALDHELLASFEAELAVPAQEPVPAARAVATEIPQELLDILAAVQATTAMPVTAYQIKKWLEQHQRKSWNPAELPRTLAVLAQDGLVVRATGRPAVYTLTDDGALLLSLAAERAHARAAQRKAQEEVANLESQLQRLAGRLNLVPGGR